MSQDLYQDSDFGPEIQIFSVIKEVFRLLQFLKFELSKICITKSLDDRESTLTRKKNQSILDNSNSLMIPRLREKNKENYPFILLSNLQQLKQRQFQFCQFRTITQTTEYFQIFPSIKIQISLIQRRFFVRPQILNQRQYTKLQYVHSIMCVFSNILSHTHTYIYITHDPYPYPYPFLTLRLHQYYRPPQPLPLTIRNIKILPTLPICNIKIQPILLTTPTHSQRQDFTNTTHHPYPYPQSLAISVLNQIYQLFQPTMIFNPTSDINIKALILIHAAFTQVRQFSKLYARYFSKIYICKFILKIQGISCLITKILECYFKCAILKQDICKNFEKSFLKVCLKQLKDRSGFQYQFFEPQCQHQNKHIFKTYICIHNLPLPLTYPYPKFNPQPQHSFERSSQRPPSPLPLIKPTAKTLL
eukprot:TRINITY_DN14535_c0_g1_i6.p1 TRINITY_DN14535_c0_g1~~TRINITY_DN14535_c0_g1_i6.p1  ORF type:complete len:417 (-),score=-15.15 TRINITY_DN14535_c0_g1_i6:84-1334(-)